MGLLPTDQGANYPRSRRLRGQPWLPRGSLRRWNWWGPMGDPRVGWRWVGRCASRPFMAEVQPRVEGVPGLHCLGGTAVEPRSVGDDQGGDGNCYTRAVKL